MGGNQLCGLSGNVLCGLDYMGRGTHTTEGITQLCEGLRGSAITSLECAAAPRSARSICLHSADIV